MKHIKLYEDFNINSDEYPLNKELYDIMNKYKGDFDPDSKVSETDVVSSMSKIEGDGSLDIDGNYPQYTEDIGGYRLLVFGSISGLMRKNRLSYEIKLVDLSTETTSQIGGGYGTSGIDSRNAKSLAWVTGDESNYPKTQNVDFISNVIKDFKINKLI